MLGCSTETIQCLWPSKTVPKTKGYLETAIERPTYLATLTSVHGIAISVFIYFSEK